MVISRVPDEAGSKPSSRLEEEPSSLHGQGMAQAKARRWEGGQRSWNLMAAGCYEG